MNQQTILKNLELADKIVDEACNTGYTLQDSDVRILKSIFGIIREELNITYCPDCKYCDEGSICEKCGFKVPLKYLSCPLCKELDRIEGL